MDSNNAYKILIIDDEEDILFTIKEICSFGGWKAICATNGKEGYNLFKTIKPSLVMIDYHMPEWDGLTTVKKIRQLDNTVSILVLTVDERQEIAEKFIAVGANDFAIKPIKSPDLISRIKINLKINEMQKRYMEKKQLMFTEKGISQATLDIITDFLNKNKDGVTIEEITNCLNLAYQTVHRYIQHLIEEKEIKAIPIYGQIGRPKNKYCLIKKFQRNML